MAARYQIRIAEEQETIRFAASELRRYLYQMTGKRYTVSRHGRWSAGPDTFCLGRFADFPDARRLPRVRDPERDDAIRVSVRGGSGYLAGTNPRSVLFAVYRFLAANGCRWLRPGKQGDWIPVRKTGDLHADLADAAAYRYRGNSHCGNAVGKVTGTRETLEKVDWMAKAGLNMCFQEGLLYHLPAGAHTAIRAAKKRGMYVHNGGHWWPAAVYNLPHSRPADADAFAAAVRRNPRHLALVDGRRTGGCHGKKNRAGPKFTELCYGRPQTRRRLVQCVADYAEAFPEIDFVHVWLSDSMNIHCECPRCIHTRPSDFYVMLLNDIDEELTRRDLPTRIGFLIYQDLLWAPEKERFRNPDRFVMMFAPIARDYDKPYSRRTNPAYPGPFRYNQNTQRMPMTGFMAALGDWQRLFDGEAFSFDYHMTWYHYFDFGYLDFARGMGRDIQRLASIGMNGLVSCQITCAAFPTAFPLHAHARYLWNPRQDFKQLCDDWFAAALGADGGACRHYMEALSACSHRDYFYRFVLREGGHPPSLQVDLKKIPTLIETFRPVVERQAFAPDSPQAESWFYIALHMEWVALLSHCFRTALSGRLAVADDYFTQLVERVAARHKRLTSALDSLWYLRTFAARVGLLFDEGPGSRLLARHTREALTLAGSLHRCPPKQESA